MVFYLAAFKGKAKTTGNPFHRITLAEAQPKDGKLTGRIVEFFADSEISTAGFEFGDIVKPIFKESELLGGRPSLVGLEKLEESPFKGRSETKTEKPTEAKKKPETGLCETDIGY